VFLKKNLKGTIMAERITGTTEEKINKFLADIMSAK
jgi:hypothetical protein